MKRISMILVAGAVLGLGLVEPAPVGAAGSTTCMVDHSPTLKPGLAAQGSSGTFEDLVLGTISCDGPAGGVTPTGPGTLYDKGNYGTKDPDSCFGGGEGEGSYTVVFPTADGERTLVLPFTVTFGDPSTNGGVVGVHVRGDGWGGDLGATPTEGDCITKPVTKVRVAGKVVFG